MIRSFTALAGLAILALPLAACDDEVPPPDYQGRGTLGRGYEGPRPGGVSDTDAPITSTYYIPETAVSHMYEVASSELALARAENPAVRRFAEQMIKDHGLMLEAMKAYTLNNPVNRAVPDDMDLRRAAMIDNLERAPADDFDRIYLGQQAAAHGEAYDLYMSYANNGMDEKLAGMAKKAAAVVRSHQELLESTRRRAGLPE